MNKNSYGNFDIFLSNMTFFHMHIDSARMGQSTPTTAIA